MTLAYRGPYIDPKEAARSYRPKSGTMSPALLRARAPYKVKNAITGACLAVVIVGIWSYSIKAVRQDPFDDVDDEAKEMARLGLAQQVMSLEDEKLLRTRPPPSSSKPREPPPSAHVVQDTRPPIQPRGILYNSFLDKRYPWLLDPRHKTLVWKAPSVDNIGSMKQSYF